MYQFNENGFYGKIIRNQAEYGINSVNKGKNIRECGYRMA